jgi:hypothetical protein
MDFAPSGKPFNSLWANEYRAVGQGAAELEKRSISGMCEHFRKGLPTAEGPQRRPAVRDAFYPQVVAVHSTLSNFPH